MLKRYFESIDNKKREERRKTRAKNRRNIAAAFTIGSLLSGAAALLFAPKAGKELRKDIAEKTVEGAEIVKKTAVAGYSRASKFTENMVEQAKAAFNKNSAKDEDGAQAQSEDSAE